MLKKVILTSVMISCLGCNSQTSVKHVSACPQIPSIGSEQWLLWVEKEVGTGDGHGHGPDYGSQEWCRVIDRKLFLGKSGEVPCSALWNEKVTQELKKSSLMSL